MQVSAETVVGDADLDVLHTLYLSAMAPLLTRAAARHVLERSEFDQEMTDPRIVKLLVRDDAGLPVGLTTITHELDSVPWISASYFQARFPDAAGRDALFYVGYMFVDPARRRSQAFLLMAAEVRRRLVATRGVVGFDVCAYNDEHGVGRWTRWLSGPDCTVSALDTQTYSVGDFRHGRPPAEKVYRRRAQPDDLRLLTLAQRPDLADEIGALLSSRWPTFMLAGRPGHDEDPYALVQDAPDHQVVAVDAEDRVRGVAFSLPIAWDGTVADLPGGWDDAITRAAAHQRSEGTSDAAVALSVTVGSDAAGRGLALRLVEALREATVRSGGRAMLAPVRPVLKERYPLVEVDEYLTWTTPDGRPFDPWVRTHVVAGAEVVGTARRSMSVTGTVAQWRTWLDDPLPGPGSYVIPGGLVPLVVEGEVGTYVEPHVWLVHDLSGAEDRG